MANAADSITEYARSRDLLDAGDTDAAAAILEDIARYNAYDCRSTLRLRDWLLERAAENAVPVAVRADLTPRGADPGTRPGLSRIECAPGAGRHRRPHRRRDGARARRRRHRLPPPRAEDLLVGPLPPPHGPGVGMGRPARRPDHHRRRGDRGLAPRRGQKLLRRILKVSGALGPGSSIGVGRAAVRPVRRALSADRAQHRTGGPHRAQPGTVLEVIDESVFVLEERLEADAPEHDALPMALTPAMPPRPGTQVDAISEWGRAVLDAYPAMLQDPALDILRRQSPNGPLAAGDFPDSRHPRQPAHPGGQLPGRAGAAGHRQDLHRLTGDRRTRGTARLEDRGRRAVARRRGEHADRRPGCRPGAGPGREEVEARRRGSRRGLDDAEGAGDPGVHPAQTDSCSAAPRGTSATRSACRAAVLDLLVIDEAGQFSLASTIASAVAAKRVLLLGDPQQLPQVSQGRHPEPVDTSALGWLTDGHNVLPPEFGYFLAKSWRMHPRLCAPVSHLAYEGKLVSAAGPRHLESPRPGCIRFRLCTASTPPPRSRKPTSSWTSPAP